jgi:hypothetical protein
MAAYRVAACDVWAVFASCHDTKISIVKPQGPLLWNPTSYSLSW